MNEILLKLQKNADKKIAFCALNFDLLDVETIRFLKELKKETEILVVGLNPNKDEIIPIEDKIKILGNLETVDFVCKIDSNLENILEIIKPHKFVEYNSTFNIYDRIIKKNKKSF